MYARLPAPSSDTAAEFELRNDKTYSLIKWPVIRYEGHDAGTKIN